MMLKTNSKQARANIRAYILNNFTPDSYTDNPPKDYPEVARFILDVFHVEKPGYGADSRKSDYELFIDWCQGLAGALNTCYYYSRSAVDDLAGILEETEAEKARFTERQAEECLTSLIYRELIREAK